MLALTTFAIKTGLPFFAITLLASLSALAQTEAVIEKALLGHLNTISQNAGKTELLEEVRSISRLARLSSVRQGVPLGLGHAVLIAEALVGNEPFGVILSDDVIDADLATVVAEADNLVPRGP